MDFEALNNSWHYYSIVEKDLANTSQYVEPRGQENVYSLEFAKILILACTEVESLFKILCSEITGNSVSANMASYKSSILGKYPRIVDAMVSVSRLGISIKPFGTWNSGKLIWWDAYQKVKHDRGTCFSEATYMNATYAVAAMHILLLYLSKITNSSQKGSIGYLQTQYSPQIFCTRAPKELPDFEVTP